MMFGKRHHRRLGKKKIVNKAATSFTSKPTKSEPKRNEASLDETIILSPSGSTNLNTRATDPLLSHCSTTNPIL